jgi:hypothetical protein
MKVCFSTRPALHGRSDILIEPEKVGWIIPVLESNQPLVIDTI